MVRRAPLFVALLLAACAPVDLPVGSPVNPCASAACDELGPASPDAGAEPDGDQEAELAVLTSTLPAPSRGRQYEATIEVEGGEPPYLFSTFGGELPAGLELSEEGVLSGVPAEAGPAVFTVRVEDSSEPPQATAQRFEVEVPEVLLLSGYGPFEGYPVNPSWEAVRVLDGERFGPYEIRAVSLPVLWDVAPEQLLDLADELEPVAIVASGVAGGRPEAFSLEETAFNEERGTDVEGNLSSPGGVVEGGPAELPSTLPLEAIHAALTEAEVAVEMSPSAGRYLCNHLFYAVVHATQESGVPAGFIHVSDRNAEIEELTAGWRIILQAVADSYSGS